MKPLFKIAATFLIAFPLSICFISITKAQTGKASINKLYIQSGPGASSQSGINGEACVQAIIRNKWSASISYQSSTMNPNNLPADYEPGSGVVFLVSVFDNIKVDMNIFSFTTGKYFPFGRKCWVTTEAGVSLVNGDKVDLKKGNQ